jgi:hypothetical protein
MAPRAVGLGARGVISVRMFTDTPLDALNLYSDQPYDYNEADLHTARVIAAHASVVLAHTTITQNLRRAIQTRNLIGQAPGHPDGPLPTLRRAGVRRAPPLLPGHQHPTHRRGRRTHPHRPPSRTPPERPAAISRTTLSPAEKATAADRDRSRITAGLDA